MPRPKHHTHVYQSFNPIRPKQAELPGHGSAPVVTDKEHLVETEFVKKGDKVADDVEGGVTGGGGRGVGVTVPAEVGGDGSVAEGGESEELVAPRVPELWEAVEEEDWWALTNLCNVHADAVYFEVSVLNFLHFCGFLHKLGDFGFCESE